MDALLFYLELSFWVKWEMEISEICTMWCGVRALQGRQCQNGLRPSCKYHLQGSYTQGSCKCYVLIPEKVASEQRLNKGP